MRKILYYVICIQLLLLSACDVHEWPDRPEYAKLHIRLNYETDMTEWKHLYSGKTVIEQGLGETYDNHQKYGEIRYVIRTYPVSDKQRTMQDYTQEFIFTKDIANGYDQQVTLDILPGNYNVMVWSDIVETDDNAHFYNANNFAEIKLQGDHKGNTNYRDAFRGTGNVSLVADVVERLPDTLDITMQRPLAKFEFITNDVEEFIDKEATRIASKTNDAVGEALNETFSGTVNIEDYKVVFYYVGFMPDTYSMNTDKPVDSSTGVIFESTLKKLKESEATMGFDYVFVNGKRSVVTVRVGIYDNEGTQLSLTEPIDVPLKRSHHTILTGMFLMSNAAGGVTIDPGYDGDHNLIFP